MPATSLGTFAQAIKDQFETALGIELVEGVLSGRQMRQIGCVWCPRKIKVEDMAVDELIEAHMRVFMAYDESVANNPEIPWDPSELYVISDQVQTEIKNRRTSLGTWFVAWQSTDIDYEDQGMEIILFGRQQNLAESYG